MTVPSPEPGLVVRFNYLWRRERDRGRAEARYARPCAVVLTYRRRADGMLLAALAAITHSPPRAGDHVLELPPRVKAHLGLDAAPSWIVLDEVNETAWPGYDLEAVGPDRWAYGHLPPALYERVRKAILALVRDGRLTVTPR
ncbi:hypothetical protein [Phenylobacterium sp.]|uniref:hypothetical protein n=1 Tax=Phenylobacterium sp. TaxID=1871053 RepID=UPI00301D9094